MVDVAEAADDLVSVQRCRSDGVEDRQLEKTLAKLCQPVVGRKIGHKHQNDALQGTCQYTVVLRVWESQRRALSRGGAEGAENWLLTPRSPRLRVKKPFSP